MAATAIVVVEAVRVMSQVVVGLVIVERAARRSDCGQVAGSHKSLAPGGRFAGEPARRKKRSSLGTVLWWAGTMSDSSQ